jgi:hypothetical protein
MSRSASAGTFGWTINGLIRSASAAVEAQSETRKGLPAFIKVVGANKLWTAEISGDVTDATAISLAHGDKVACNILADGITVLGFLTSFSCSGSSNSVVEFRAACEGKSAGAGSAADPGDPVFLEEGTITGADVTTSADIIEFSIDCSWTLEHTFSATGEPTADGTSFKSFDGSATFVTSEEGSDTTGASVGAVAFSIAVGGLTVAGTGKTTKVEQTAEVDGLIKFKRTVTIVTIT